LAESLCRGNILSPACPLCRSQPTAARYEIEIPELGPREVRECPCGFYFVSPRPTSGELQRFYSAEYFDSAPGGRGFTDYLSKAHARVGEGRLVGRRLRREKRDGRVLDVGCGAGDFLRGVAQESGWEAHGTDLSPQAIELANREPGLKLFRGELAAARYPDAHFDAVFVRNVLEHVPEPAALVEEVRRITRPGGRVWLLVPNGQTELAPFAGAKRRGGRAVDVQAHLNFFTPTFLRDWLGHCRFEVERLYTLGLKRGLFELGYLPRAWKVSERHRRAATDKPAAPPRPASQWKDSLAYAYLRRALKASLKLPLWLPLGQELHAVLRRI
jgi:SAM-dependent methyltransferase